VADGTPAELKSRVGGDRLDLTAASRDAFGALVDALGGRAVQVERERLTVGVPTDGSAAHVRALLDELDPARTAVTTFELHSASLDDVFLTLTGRPAEPEPAELLQVKEAA